ncbi:MAG: TerB N-terminal domain-containing protein [Betaproteobacteria bacterium]|nr:TerB N-terminal domain-containing protein [Betaproteobacteria bacterium]
MDSARELIEVAGLSLPGGMLYVGKNLPTLSGYTDPALIDITKRVSTSREDPSLRQMGYWPSYSEVSPAARRAYLQWLAGGRRDPHADVGYVFLFFYGLERRVVIDAPKDPTASVEIPLIAAEVQRLLSLYGEKSVSVRNYLSRFLELIAVPASGAPLYLGPVPPLPHSYELPFYLRLALGQTAVDKVPVPAHIALAWADHDPTISKRTPVVRCAEQYRVMFPAKYRELCGEGIKLPINRTKLKLVYQPASSGFRGAGEISRKFGNVPDVTSLVTVTRTLQAVVDACSTELDSYSRYIRKNPDKTTALEAILQLPASIWPPSAREVLDKVSKRMGAGLVVMPLAELTTMLNAGGDLTRDKMLGFSRALESMNIGIEPDVLNGAKLPKASDKIVLFAMQPGDSQSRSGSGFNAAAVMLQLATAVAFADGDLSSAEIVHLSKQIDAWQHLTPAQQRRLKAHLRLLMVAPVPMTTMKKKLEPLDTAARSLIATFVASIAQLDGVASQAEMKTLEKIYTALGLPSKQLYSDIHVAATGVPETGPSASEQPRAPGDAYVLDPARIAALQRDSDRVSALLSNIFVDDAHVIADAAAKVTSTEETDAEITESTTVMGLDSVHSAFVHMIISRPHWSRSELEDVAADMELMLDGALERVNEAAFDKYDLPLTQGDDPIETNTEILDKLDP